jgi:acyl dehydratase
VVYGHGLLWRVLFDPDLKLNLSKLVHGEQEFIYHKPVKVGDVITSGARIDKIYQKGPHDFVVLISEAFNQNNEKVCDSIWTFVIRGGNDKDFTLQEKIMIKILSFMPPCPRAKAKQQKALKALMTKAAKTIPLDRAQQDLVYYEKISAAEEMMQVFIDKYMPQVYAGASGDFNIIHLDEAFGRSVGLGGNILHGMATMALGANFAMKNQAPDLVKRYRARFSAPVKPLDTITYKGSWSGKELKFKASNQKGEEVINSASFEVY